MLYVTVELKRPRAKAGRKSIIRISPVQRFLCAALHGDNFDQSLHHEVESFIQLAIARDNQRVFILYEIDRRVPHIPCHGSSV